ncbi:MAG: hypothetical protein AAF604_23345 [Acidobacteriota bacterium]
MRHSFTLLLIAISITATSTEAQTVLQNDDLVDFGSATIQAGFVAGESGASWLTTPCSGQITAVRIVWLSLLGGQGNTLGEAIRIHEAGTFPVPGTLLADLAGPVLTDGFENEFTLPVPIAVQSGQTFVVSFQFLNAPPALGPSLVTDTSGCMVGRNGIFAIPPSAWLSACLLGVSGDFAIRAVVDCGTPEIFTDGFESGDTDAWSATAP